MLRLLLLFTTLFSVSISAKSIFQNGFSNGNKIDLLLDGEANHRARLEIINSARRSILLSAFSIYTQPSTNEILAALCRKSRDEQVEVRILADATASSSLKKIQSQLQACGIFLMFFNPRHASFLHKKLQLSRWAFSHSLNIIHEKLLIVDGEQVILGGSNYGTPYREYHRDNNKKGQYFDLNVKITGPAACYFHQAFAKNWQQSVEKDLARYLRTRAKKKRQRQHIYGPDHFIECEALIKGKSRIIPVYANPMFSNKRPILDRYLEAIKASDKITLVAPYFQPVDAMIDALITAKERGADIRILINSDQSNDEPLSLFATMGLSRKLLAAGIEIYMWPKLSTLHKKASMFENARERWVYIGSDNLSGRAQNYNSETVMFTDDQQTVATMAKEFELDFTDAEKLTESRRSVIYQKFSKWLRRSFKYVRELM